MTLRPCTPEEIKEAARRSKEKEQSQKDFIKAVKETLLSPEILNELKKVDSK